MIASVAVFGFTLKPVNYSYLIPNGLDVFLGDLVEVPFGKRTSQGVVTEISSAEDSQYQLKEIKQIKTSFPVVTKQQLDLAKFISQSYFVSVAEALQLMLPRMPKINELKPSPALAQELYLFPTLKQAREAAATNKALVFTQTDPAKVYDQKWGTIRAGSAKTVFATRSGVFAPFKRLKKITIFQSESDLYKDERRPYYRSLEVLNELARLHGASVRAVSFSPRVQDQFLLPHTVKKIVPLPIIKTIDLKNAPIINESLLKIISRLAEKRVLVFLNRKSEKGPLLCRTCKTRSYTDDPSVCPNCGSADIKFQLINLASIEKQINAKLPEATIFATQQILFQEKQLFDVVIILSADTYLGSAHFNSSEKTFQLLTNLIRLVKPEGQLVVQSAHLNDPGISYALQNNYGGFFAEELSRRRETNYPPYSKLLKATYTGKSAMPEPKSSGSVEVFGPFAEKKKYYVLRYQDPSDLPHLERPWKLDLDPLSF